MEIKQTVLVVEDEPVNRKILNKLLSESYRVLEAENGAVAWDLLSRKENSISAVLLDIVMPVMDGYALMEKIRQAQLTDLPIIIMTGETTPQSEQKALDAGAWDFVTKPLNARVLLSRLKNAIARSQIAFYEKMRYLAQHDALTGVYNRGKLFSATKEMLASYPHLRFVFLRLDVDRFSLFNASFGEAAGDELLKYLAALLQDAASSFPVCTFGRMNADIFCACVPFEGDRDTLSAWVNGIQQKLADYRHDYLLEVSVGACLVDGPKTEVEDLFFRASMGTQKCKNQYAIHLGFYDEATGRKMADEIAITNDMQSALTEQQFKIYFQPKFRLSTDRACGAEALVRWQHPVRGLISPGAFIPIFERNGFIARLDRYVWEQVCRILRDWIDRGMDPDPVSVNVSRVSLYNPQLVDVMLELVQRYRLPTTLLQLEVTESAYMTNPDLMRETIHALRAAGFTLLMDDFGSGYSSLNMLKEIEVDILKVDMKFLPVQHEMEKGEIILASVIKMVNWIGMNVVVEGVETRKQRDFLEGTGCDCVQGYYYAAPMPLEDYTKDYVALGRESAQSPAAVVEALSPKHNVTILVIDDDEMEWALLQEYFGGQYHVHCCDSAEAGLAYLKRNKGKVRLILVDNIMPGMTGLDFLLYCQMSTALQSIPKIMITANDQTQDQVQAFQYGAYDYLTKPLVREVVQARIQHVMEISRQTSQFDSVETSFQYLSERDSETSLLNKTAFREISTRLLTLLPEEPKALLVIDIDDFKQINDNFGHLSGDSVIGCVAEELVSTFRKTDVLGRFGGDEFVVLLSGLSNQEVARRKASEIIKSVAFTCAKCHNMDASISVGLAFSMPTDTFDTLFARADQALYEAKNTGKGKAVIYGEQVPPISDDDKPIVLVCGEDPQLYPSIALAYGNSVSFARIAGLTQLQKAFDLYGHRIHVICLDMRQKTSFDPADAYQYLLTQGGGTQIPILAVCQDGDMQQFRKALELNVHDVLTMPPQGDVIQRRLSRALILASH